MIVAFTGHRPNKLGGYGYSVTQTEIRKAIRLFLVESNATHVISGMALGVDQWAAEEAIELKIPFTAAIPCDGQDSQWPLRSKAWYQELLTKANSQVIVSSGSYEAHKMQARNEWMVDRCEYLMAIWNGSSGGTANCVRYAQTVRKPIFRYDPKVKEHTIMFYG